MIGLTNQLPKKKKESEGGNNIQISSDNIGNVATWLLDYKTYGENSYAFIDKDIWTAILESRLAINDKVTSSLALDHALGQGGHAGKVIGSMYGIGEADWDSLPTIIDICNNETACNAVFNHNVASRAILEYNDYELIRTRSDEIYTILNNQPNAINILLNSAKYKPLLQANKTSSYNDYCILTTCTSNIGQNSNGSSNEYGGIQVYSFCKAGLKYTNVDNTVTVLCSKQGTGGYISFSQGNSTESGTRSQPYTTTNYTVNKIVKNVTVEPGNNTYSNSSNFPATATSTGVINYIPI